MLKTYGRYILARYRRISKGSSLLGGGREAAGTE
jgi:hypothetical protein